MRQKSLLTPLSVAGAFLFLVLGIASMVAAQGDVPDAATCAGCHEDQVAAFEGNPHTLLNDPAWGKYGIEGGSCASCHEGAAEHVEEGGGLGTIFAYGDDVTAKAKSEACLECHSDTHPRFFTSEHAQSGVACTDCHSVHQPGHKAISLIKSGDSMASADPAEKLDASSQLCVQCHTDVAAKFQFNERHRLQEGILSCTTCHNPHERATRARLGGFKQQQVCLECHADKGGPFIFEHGSVRGEGCTACHEPHGSPNRHMLAFQDLGQLCYSCHAVVPGFHVSGFPSSTRFSENANCVNCHSAIHGSNFHPAFLQ